MFLDVLKTGTLLGTKSKKQVVQDMPEWLQDNVAKVAPKTEEETMLWLNVFAETYSVAARPQTTADSVETINFEEEHKVVLSETAMSPLENILQYPFETGSLLMYLTKKVRDSEYILSSRYLIPVLKLYENACTKRELAAIALAFGEKGQTISKMLFPNQQEKKEEGFHFESREAIKTTLADFSKYSLTKKLQILNSWNTNTELLGAEIVDALRKDFEQIKVQNSLTATYDFQTLWFQFIVPESTLFEQYKDEIFSIFDKNGKIISEQGLNQSLEKVASLLKPYKEGNTDLITFVLAFIFNTVPVDSWMAYLKCDLPQFVENMAHNNQPEIADWKLEILHQNLLQQFVRLGQWEVCEHVLEHWSVQPAVFELLVLVDEPIKMKLINRYELYKQTDFEKFIDALDVELSTQAVQFLISKWQAEMYPAQVQKKIYRYLPYWPKNAKVWETMGTRYQHALLDFDILEKLVAQRDTFLKLI